MDLIENINKCTSDLMEARQRLAQLHEMICNRAISGSIRIEDNIVDHSIWNNYGRVLIGAKMYSDAEQIYDDMLDTIRALEKTKGELHKGLPTYNIGIVQFLQRNFDEGIPNILEAYEHDIKRVGANDAKKLFASRFKTDLNALVGSELNSRFITELRKSTSLRARSSTDLIQALTESEFLFFARIILCNVHIKFRKDPYTSVILYDNLRNLCLLLEVLLKRKTSRDESIGPLLNFVFDKEGWLRLYNTHKQKTRFEATTVKDAVGKFDANLEFLESKLGSSGKEEFLARVFLTTVLVRHFTSHYFDAYPDLIKNQVLYEKIFKRAVFSVLYSLDRGGL